MSKRKLAEYEKLGILVYLHQYIERGYLPEALLNYLARLGWSYDGTQEIFARDEYHHGMELDQYVGRGTLKAGRNELLVKVHATTVNRTRPRSLPSGSARTTS